LARWRSAMEELDVDHIDAETAGKIKELFRSTNLVY
jgi:hypothetical protein